MGALRRRLVTTTAALVVAGSFAGCSSDDSQPDASDPTPSSSTATSSPTTSSTTSTTSPSPTASPEPKPPSAPPAKATEAGRKAFAEFVVARWGFALRTNDAEAVTGLSPRSGPCRGCRELEAELKKRAKEGWYVDFPGAEVVKVEVGPGEEPGVHVALAEIDVPASQSYFEDGALRNENKARKGATFEVRMRLDGKRYSLLAFRVA